MFMERLISIVIATYVGTSAACAAADCSPQDFLLREATELVQNNEIRLAFVESMTATQFSKAKQTFSGGAKFPINGVPIEGYSDLESAKAAGRAEASARRFNLDQQQSTHLIANRISSVGAAAYIECLGKAGAGLAMWVKEEAGNTVKVSFLFRPRDKAYDIKKFGLQGFVLLSELDKEMIPSETQTLLFRRLGDGEGSIEARIGRERESIVFPPRVRLIEIIKDSFISPEFAEARSGGSKADGVRRYGSACTRAPAGWKFVQSSAKVLPQPGTTADVGHEIESSSPAQICWKVFADTSAWKRVAYIKARLSAEMEQPATQK
jgi:hypothetical protein